MVLRHSSDISAGAWIATADADWAALVTLGPPGFAAYARVAFPTSPESPDWRPETEVFADLVDALTPHTRSPSAAWFGLWDGWGDIEDQAAARYVESIGDQSSWFGRFFRSPRDTTKIPAAFEPSVLSAPRLSIPPAEAHRAYLLFHGPLADAGDWGAAPMGPGWPARDISVPNLMWPEDRAWCVAADVDPDWIGVGGSGPAIDAVLADPRLTTEAVDYGPHPSSWETA